MSTVIPEEQVQFAQLAAKQRLIPPEQVRHALELYRRYQAVGGDVPSVARIMVGKGMLTHQNAELLLRHLMLGEPLPSAAAPVPMAPQPAPIRPSGHAGTVIENAVSGTLLEEFNDLGLEPAGSAVDLSLGKADAVDEKQAYIEGLGATVLNKEVREIKGYKITQVIGEGSMGIVYRAHQISMDRTVALKVLPPEKTKNQRFVEEFLTEARNAGRLNHPNLIRVHEVGKSGETYYYSMEYVEGQRLDEWMDECENGRLLPKEVIPIFVQVAGALDYGFRSGVIHREIRPNSIMVSDDGQAKLSDLGLTRDEHQRFLDGENAYYVSPEQAKGMDPDTRSDIYSLGCCLFHALTGEPPFEGGGPKEVLGRRLLAQAPNPLDYNEDLPPDLADVVMRMMERDPKDRFQTANEVAEALKRISTSTQQQQKVKPKFGMKPMLRKPGLNRRYGSGGARNGRMRRRR